MAIQRLYRSLVVVIIISVLGLSPIIASSEEASVYPEIYGEDIIRIGATFSLSGKYTLEGLQALCGVKAAVDWINENGGIEFQGELHRVQIVYFDDKSSPDMVKELYSVLSGELGLRFLIAPYGEELLEAALESVDAGKTLLAVYSPSSAGVFNKGYMAFQTTSPSSLRFSALIDMIKEVNARTIAVFYKDNSYGEEVFGEIKRLASKADINVVGGYPYSDPSGVLDAARLVGDVVDVVVVVDYSYNDLRDVVASLYEARLNARLVVLDSPGSLSSIYVDLGSVVAENTVVSVEWESGAGYNRELAVQYKTDWYGPEEDEWLNYYRDHCKTAPPSSIAASASAALLMIANGIYWAGSDDPQMVWDKLGGLFTMSFYGLFSIDPRSGVQTTHENILVQWQNGDKWIIYPSSIAEAELIYPAGNWLRTATMGETAITTGAPSQPGDPTIIISIIIAIIVIVALLAMRKRA